LDALLLELSAILGLEGESILAAIAGLPVFGEGGEIMLEQRLVAERAFAVGPAFRRHLEQTQIDTELDFLRVILPFESANRHFSRAVIPLVEKLRDVKAHVSIKDNAFGQVNLRPWPDAEKAGRPGRNPSANAYAIHPYFVSRQPISACRSVGSLGEPAVAPNPT
jgi:hypothetical protein